MAKFISPLTWPGGKSKQWKLIKHYFPKNTEKMAYVESFCGGSSIGLNALKEEMFLGYNFRDIDKDLIEFWNEMISYDWENLENWFYPNVSLEILKENLHNAFGGLRFLLENNLTFNGQRWGSWTQQRLEQNWNLNKFKRILECSNLLKKHKDAVWFNNKDILEIKQTIKLFPNYIPTFYFLDPPYYTNGGKPYKFKFKKNDWIIFKEYINSISKENDKFLLTIDDCLQTRELFKDYFIHEVEWKYTSSNTKGNKTCKVGKELIITNYLVERE